MGQTPIKSGTTTFVEVIGVAVGSQTLGRLYPRIGPRIMCTIGGFGLTLYLAAFLVVDDSTSLVGGARADVLRRLRQLGRLPGDPDLDVRQHLERRHRPRLRDLQHPAPVLDRDQHRDRDDDRRRSRRHRAGAFHAAYLGAAIMAAIGTVLAWTLIDNRLAGSTMVRAARRGAADVGDLRHGQGVDRGPRATRLGRDRGCRRPRPRSGSEIGWRPPTRSAASPTADSRRRSVTSTWRC